MLETNDSVFHLKLKAITQTDFFTEFHWLFVKDQLLSAITKRSLIELQGVSIKNMNLVSNKQFFCR